MWNIYVLAEILKKKLVYLNAKRFQNPRRCCGKGTEEKGFNLITSFILGQRTRLLEQPLTLTSLPVLCEGET